MNPNVPNTLRKMNTSIVLNVIRQQRAVSRAQLSEITGITKATVSEIINDLLNEKLVHESGIIQNQPLGRKGILINFSPNHGLALAIDVGGTKISFGLFNLDADLLAQHTERTYKVSTRKEFMDKLIAAIDSFIQLNVEDIALLKVIGIATPGIVDYKNGIVLEGSPNLPEWENVLLKEEISSHFNLPVVIENDIRAALIGECWCGKCQSSYNAALIGIGTGLGAALLIDGKVIRGSHNAAGEIGYMLFEQSHLYRNWLNKGCFESYCSGSGLSQTYQDLSGEKLTAENIFEQALEGDILSKSIINQLVNYLAIGILNISALINVDKVILTGGLSKAISGEILNVLSLHIQREILRHTKVSIEISELREKAALFGVSILALSEVYPSIEFITNVKIK